MWISHQFQCARCFRWVSWPKRSWRSWPRPALPGPWRHRPGRRSRREMVGITIFFHRKRSVVDGWMNIIWKELVGTKLLWVQVAKKHRVEFMKGRLSMGISPDVRSNLCEPKKRWQFTVYKGNWKKGTPALSPPSLAYLNDFISRYV